MSWREQFHRAFGADGRDPGDIAGAADIDPSLLVRFFLRGEALPLDALERLAGVLGLTLAPEREALHQAIERRARKRINTVLGIDVVVDPSQKPRAIARGAEVAPVRLTIEVCRRMDGRTYHAQVQGRPGLWGAGSTEYEAIGSLIASAYWFTGVAVEFRDDVTR